MFLNFIWKGKDRVSRNLMVQDYYSLGGVRMVDVALYMESLKVTWIQRLLVTKCSGWASLAHVILNIFNLSLLEGGPLSTGGVHKNNLFRGNVFIISNGNQPGFLFLVTCFVIEVIFSLLTTLKLTLRSVVIL